MNTEQINYLAAINRYHSLRQASEFLHITPQALSQSLIALEKEYMLKLTKSSRSGTFLTREGQILLEAGQEFLAVISELQTPYTASATLKNLPKAKISIATASGLLNTFLPKAISKLYQDYPNIQLYLKKTSTYDIVQQLENNTCDSEIAIISIYEHPFGTLPDLAQYPSLEFQPLATAKYVCSAPKNSEIYHYSSISFSNMLKYPIIIYAPSVELTLPLLSYYGSAKKIISVPNYSVFTQLLQDDDVSLTFARQFNTFEPLMPTNARKLIPFKENIKAAIGYVYRKDHAFSPEIADFIEYITDFYANLYGKI